MKVWVSHLIQTLQVLAIESRKLTAFLAVVDHGSFSRAARALYRSQPAVTTQIQRLEEELGVRLLHRNERGVRTTSAGEAFLPQARAVIVAMQQAALVAREAAEKPERLRFGFPRSVSRYIMPKIITELHRLHPSLKIDLMPLGTSTVVTELYDNSLDVGFVRLPLAAKGLSITKVHSEPMMICLPAAHQLAASRKLRLGDLREERFIVYGRRWAPGFYDQMMLQCHNAGFSPSISCEIDEMYVAPSFVAAGEGVAIMPKMTFPTRPPDVVVRELDCADWRSELGIAVHAGELSSLLSTTVDIATAVCRDISAV